MSEIDRLGLSLEIVLAWEGMSPEEKTAYMAKRVQDRIERQLRYQFNGREEEISRREAALTLREDDLTLQEEQLSKRWSRWNESMIELEIELARVRLEDVSASLAYPWVIPASVYYLQRQDGDVKIGTSKHVSARKKNLESSFGKLVLRAVEPGGRQLEQNRHREFSTLRRGKTEWFESAESLMAHVSRVEVRHQKLYSMVARGLL